MSNQSQKISKRNIQDILSLTSLQEGMLFHYLQNPDSDHYFEQLSLELRGCLSLERMKQAWDHVIATNEMLRTVFRWEKLAKPVQVVLKSIDLPIRFFDLSGQSEEEQTIGIRSIKARDQREGIDLSTQPFRVTVVQLGPTDNIMILSNHHILYDGWSTGIILKEFLEAYSALANGKMPPVQPKNSFTDFVKWQGRQDREAQQRYWVDYLQGFANLTPVPESLSQQPRMTGTVHNEFIIGKETTDALRQLVQEMRITPATVLYTAWGIWLQRYNNTDDVVFGTTVSGRDVEIANPEEMVGLFINTIPLRVTGQSGQTILELLQQVDQSLRMRSQYEHVPLVDIKSYSPVDPQEPLLDSIVVIENYPLDRQLNDLAGDLKIESYSMVESTHFDLTLAVEMDEELACQFIYDGIRFAPEEIEKFVHHFTAILKGLVHDPERRVAEIEMISRAERELLVYQYNETDALYPDQHTAHQLFEERAVQLPDQIAVQFNDQQITYAELNQRANQLAHFLQEQGVTLNQSVGLRAERSLELMIGILAIMKAGGVYVPINVHYPAERARFMLEDSGAKLLLTHQHLQGQIDFAGPTFTLEDQSLYNYPDSNLEVEQDVEDRAYIIYTSGSTGQPKGVVVTHQSLVNFVFSYYADFNGEIGPEDRGLTFANISFDASMIEIFPLLTFGGTQVFFNNDFIPDVKQLAQFIIDEGITILFLPPTLLKPLYQLLSEQKVPVQLNKMGTGMEPILDYVFADYLKLHPRMQAVNAYGPTETTVYTTTYKYTSTNPVGQKVPIGKPMNNIKVYVLDQNLQPVPVGVTGELCIAGRGVTLGYLNQPELTAEKFIPNPFIPGTRMYKSGDLVRWLPDGNIEFMGRVDYQVKIRGFRIEPGEIENKLLHYPPIRDALVMPREDQQGNKYLCAYVVAEREVTVKEMREALRADLPDFMIPSYFIQIDQMPLTPNGKTNRKALPKPEGNIIVGTEYQAPENLVQERLVTIWKELLGGEQIGIDDNFFERGGHSLKATSLVGKIAKVFDVDVPLNQIFQFPTIRELSTYIQKASQAAYNSIERVADQEVYETSSAQKRIYMLQQFDLQNTNYNMPGVFEVQGKLDLPRVTEALESLIQRHETLRTSFETAEEEIYQRVHPQVTFNIEELELELDLEEAGRMETILQMAMHEFVRPFDLSKAPLLRVGVLTLEEGRSLLLFDMHHIISDGTSMAILTQDFVSLYEGDELPPLSIQYRDFATWQNEFLQSEMMAEQEAYWLEQFADELPVLSLPLDYPRPVVQDFAGETLYFTIDQELAQGLKRIAQETGSTLYMVLLAGLNILLAKYSGQTDLIIGSPVAGRSHPDLEQVIGMFINTLALRNKPEGEKSYRELLLEVKETALQAYAHQDYQFEELVDRLELQRDLSRNPLFDLMFAMQNMEQQELQLQNLNLRPYQYEKHVAKFDLTISATERDDEIALEMEYCTSLFKRGTIQRMFAHLKKILRTVTLRPETQIRAIELLSDAEKMQIVQGFNQTQVDNPEQTIHQLFAEQVAKNPDQRAVVAFGESMTYQELEEQANALAMVLRAQGVQDEMIVGIIATPSLEMMIGIMAILKAGGAYLPIDPEYPAERMELMIEDCAVEILLDQQGLAQKLGLSCTVLDLPTQIRHAVENFTGKEEPLSSGKPTSLAYVIYTSGSTGRPKGVMVEQQSIVRLVKNPDYVRLQPGDKILQTGTLAFDASTFEIWGALGNGGEVHLGHKDLILSPEKMGRYLAEEEITILFLTTALFNLFAEDRPQIFQYLSYLLTGGENVSPRHIRKVKQACPELQLVHVYGPTENTTFSTSYLIEDVETDLIPIGKPIHNSTAYILSQDDQLAPIGVHGELCVGGVGLGRGYINNPALTAEKFVENPYLPGEKMYRTGDLARWLPDGNIDFLGRVDHQVKIRGFRIEPGEIENHLLKHQAVEEAIVVDFTDEKGTKYLAAYLVAEGTMTGNELRTYLGETLPEYMIPAHFIQLEEMPLNRNGKVDRPALPEPESGMITGTEYVAPRNELEMTLASLWSEILGLARVGIHDNFFEIGGHSLRATILVSKIHQACQVELSLREIFKRPTIQEQALYIASLEKNLYASIQPVPKQEYYPASSAQVRLYLQYQFEGAGVSYNMPWAFMVEGKLDSERVDQAFQEIIRRHETLRTSFEMIDGAVMQKVAEQVAFTVERFSATEEELPDLIREFVQPFDLKEAPLLRIGIVDLAQERQVLLFDMHHIISDGTSMGVLVQEFMACYQSQSLPALPIQYKDFSAWQNELFATGQMQDQLEYWLDRFAEDLPILNLPTDYPRPGIQSFVGDRIAFELDQELTERLHQFSQEQDVTLYMTLLAVYNLLLAKYTGQEDIIVGSPIAGRPHADLQGIVGMFVNTLAMRNYPARELTFVEFLQQVQETAMSAYENQDYPFERLVDELDLKRDTSRNPVFDTMFGLQNMESGELKLEGMSFTPYQFENLVSKFDLSLFAYEDQGKIRCDLEYCTELFKRETMTRFVQHFLNLVEQVLLTPEESLAMLDFVSATERSRVLVDFNQTESGVELSEKTIHQLFMEQAARRPDRLAVVLGEESMTYRELDLRSNQLARSLRTQLEVEEGTSSDRVIALMVERSLEMVVGLLAILKAGAGFLPIDPDYPRERIHYMLDDSGAELLLTQERLLDQVEFTGQLINLDDPAIYHQDDSALELVTRGNDLLYLIYTSGSTGQPKGAMLEHQNLVNLIQFQSAQTEIDFTSRVLQFTTISFDVSYQEIFSTLLAGGELVLIDEQVRKEPEKLLNFVAEDQIQVLFLPTSYFKFIMAEAEYQRLLPATLKDIIVAGEQLVLSKGVVQALQEREITLHNHYGPSETHVVATYTIHPGQPASELPPIGKPICNTRLYIGHLDQQSGRMQVVPEGIVGELLIAGASVGRGYQNRPELTAEKFLEDPFVSGERLYRTGDMARWLPDGNVEFLGRMDHQVKIRGYRVEPGEIESLLLSHDLVKEVLVQVKGDRSEQFLCAYFTGIEQLTVADLRAFVGQELPDYMIPSYFVQLERMPLTPNGKIDRKALPEPEGELDTGTDYVAPTNLVEEQLVAIWQEILGVAGIGTQHNFFDLGGHSLKATILISQIHKTLNVEVPLREIFTRPTIEALADYIAGLEEQRYLAIRPVEEREYYPASSAQKRLYLQNQLEGAGVSYNMPGALLVKGDLDLRRLEMVFDRLVTRHETLRTSFDLVEGEVVQRVEPELEFELVQLQANSAQIEEIVTGFVRPFDLKQAPLLRVGVAQVALDQHLLIFDMHHIISDGTSMGVLVKEFVTLYEGETGLPPLTIQYKDYSSWQAEFFQTEMLQKQADYWRETFAGEIPVLNLPTDHPRPSIQSFAGGSTTFRVGSELTAELHSLAKGTDTTLYMVLLGCYNLLLAKYSGQDDIVVGTPVAGRNHADLQGLIGMFVNTLAIRNHPGATLTFTEFLQMVKENALQAYENQDYPFEELIEELALRRDLSRNPLFDVTFAMQNMDQGELQLADLTFTPYHFEQQVSKFDLTLSAEEVDQGITFTLEYSTGLFTTTTIERMIAHLQTLFAAVVADPELPLGELKMLTEQEQEQILYEFNDTKVEYPKEKTLDQLFMEQVVQNPDQVALRFGQDFLTYRELAERADALAVILREKGVQGESIVGILAEPSLEMIIGVLGIIKAGGAYLPIDPDYPAERIQLMLADCSVRLILTQGDWRDDLEGGCEQIDLTDESLYLATQATILSDCVSRNLAYIIYTSGSTGRPKGVMVEQQSIIRLVKNTDLVEFVPGERILQTGTLAFDASTFEIWGALLNGLELHLVARDVILRAEEFERYLAEEQITTIFLTTSLFNLMSDQNPKMFAPLKYLLVGGEAASPKHMYQVRQACPELKLHNIYGPTENTTFSTSYVLEKDGLVNIPIGRPIANSTAYIYDQQNQLCPIGIFGELCVGGDGLARGYLNNPELTAEKFVTNPLLPDQRMYRTGDLVRWLSDGRIEFLGRIDHQVKIRGFRIELGELENRLLQHEEIDEVVVTDGQDENGNKYLAAYFVAHRSLAVNEMREYLAQHLPEYMIPSYFIQLEQLPLNQNGKADRKALPKPGGNLVIGTEYEAPGSELETKLAQIWEEVLGLTQVGISDNFFELGGHSLKATVLLTQLHKEFGVELPLRDFFQQPTIKEVARLIEATDPTLFAEIHPVPEQEYYPASAAQKRLYIQNQFAGIGVSYNMPGAVTIEGGLDQGRLEQVFQQLVERHETLRTYFKMQDDEVVQMIESEVEFAVERLDLGTEEPGQLLNNFIRPFDLSRAPLLRVGLSQITPEKHLLVFDLHHIISDGVSMENLIQEFIALYQGQSIPELKIQYKDFAVWQQDVSQIEKMKEQEEYWLEKFGGEIPVLNLPIDYPRPVLQSFAGERLDGQIDQHLMEQLKDLASETGTTLYMLLLAAYNILLAKYSGQDDLIVGSPIAGRRHADLQPIIGMFVNMLALRNAPVSSKSFTEFLAEVRENTLQAFDHQDYQFEELVEQLQLKRDLSRNPLFNVIFSLQDATQRSVIETADLRLVPFNLEGHVAKYDLTLEVIEEPERLLFSLEYCTDLFAKSTMERLAGHFLQLLQGIIENPDAKLAELDILTSEERSLVLEEFMGPKLAYATDQTLHGLFEQQVEATPDRIAVVEGEKSWTYAELNTRANQLAHYLRSAGVSRDEIVAIMADRSSDILLAILGIIKAGGAYMPIDPQYPQERIKYMLADSEARLLLTQAAHLQNAGMHMEEGEVLELSDPRIVTGSGDNLPQVNQPKDLAYVMYTSGSTGKPKGVMIEHQGVVSLSAYYNELFDLDQGKHILHLSNVSFDTSVVEIFPPLIYGATVYVIGKELALDRERLMNFIQENQIHFAQFVPMTLQEILAQSDKPESLDTVIVGSDKLDDLLKDQILALGYRLTNHYGPTEGTVDAIVALCEPGQSTIGKPIPNTQAYILDQDQNPTPIGVPGELWIAGVGLARGYLNRPELTAEKFLPNPWIPGEQMYRTGDLAAWQPDGNITFLGRMDNQVKIRGYRIELGEIELQLLKHPKITGAVVIDRVDGQKNKYLCGYIVAQEELSVSEIREHLMQELPEYMIPAHFIQLEKIPVTHNGKVDHRALPEPDGTIEVKGEYMAATDPVQEKLITIWQEVLDVQGLGIQHNFFEIGGHSLKAVQIVNRVQEEFQVQLALQDIFALPTIREQASLIQSKDQSIYTQIARLPEQEHYQLSYNQKRLWIISQLEPDSKAYNLPGRVTMDQPADEQLIQGVINKLVSRHESLRTQFTVVEGNPVQMIKPADSIQLQTFDLLELSPAARAERREEIFQELIYQPFSLMENPLLRVALVKWDEGRFDIVFSMHHIISDGWSMDILEKEFHLMYRAAQKGADEKLAPLTVQYKDFAHWQNQLVNNSDQNREARAYWLNKLEQGFPVMNLPQDYPAGSLTDRKSAGYRMVIPEELKDQLKEQAHEQNASLFMVMATALQMFLADLTGEERVAIGVPSSGRQHSSLAHLIGFFINTIILVNEIDSDRSLAEMIKVIQRDTLQALEYQDYPLELITDELQIQYPKIQVFFNMLNTGQTHLETLADTEARHITKVHDVKFGIMFYLTEYANGIEIICTYLSGLYKPATIEYLVGEYVRSISQLLGSVEEDWDDDFGEDDDLILIRG